MTTLAPIMSITSGKNLLTNPSFEYGTSGLADGWSITNDVSGSGFTSIVVDEGARCQQIQQLTIAATSDATILLYQLTPVGSFSKGDTATGSFWVKAPVASAPVHALTWRAYLDAWASSGGFVGASPTANFTPSDTEWTKIVVSFPNLPAGTSSVRLGIQLDHVYAGDSLRYLIDDACVSNGTTDYNDGSTYTVTDYSFPEASKTPEAVRIEAGSGIEVPNALADAAWSITWKVCGADGYDVNDKVRTLGKAFGLWSEVATRLPGEPFDHVMFLTAVNAPMFTMYPAQPGGVPYAIVTLSGSRYGYWLATSESLAADSLGVKISSKSITVPGSVSIVDVPGVSAGFARVKVTLDAGGTFLAFGPTNDLGVTWGHTVSSSITLSGSNQSLGATADLVAALTDDVIVLLTVNQSEDTADEVILTASATIGGSDAVNAGTVYGFPTPAANYGAAHVENLGVLPVPPYPIPSIASTSTNLKSKITCYGKWVNDGLGSETATSTKIVLIPATYSETFPVSAIGTLSSNQGVIVENMSPLPANRRAYFTSTATATAAGGPVSRYPYGFGLWMPTGASDWVFHCDGSTGAHVTIWYRSRYPQRIGSV